MQVYVRLLLSRSNSFNFTHMVDREGMFVHKISIRQKGVVLICIKRRLLLGSSRDEVGGGGCTVAGGNRSTWSRPVRSMIHDATGPHLGQSKPEAGTF